MNKNTNKIEILSFRPRVRLTAFCNRSCSYCFAKDYLSKRNENDEIDLTTMEKILCMCKEEKINSIGWQGGEPTLHSKIKQIINLHKKYEIKAMVFTNGLIPKETIIMLSEIVDAVLVNCNEPSSYKENELSLLFENIKLMQELYGKDKVAIGINIYSDKMDASFILDYALKTGINEVRIDITRPSPSNANIFIDYSNINNTFNMAKKIHKLLCDKGINYVHFDCPFPFCVISNKNVEYLSNYINSDLGHGQCCTALDISTNANITACFCSVQFKDIKMDKFDSLTHAWLFIKYIEDEIKWNIYTKDSCRDCSDNKKRLCQGGCLGYKPQISTPFDEKKMSYKEELFEKARVISQLFISYKRADFDDCYKASNAANERYANNTTIREISMLAAINLRKEKDFKKEIDLLLIESFYPSLDALVYATELKKNGFLDLAIYAAELGVKLEKNINKYKLHYFLFEAYKEKNIVEKSNINLINFYKLSPDFIKKR